MNIKYKTIESENKVVIFVSGRVDRDYTIEKLEITLNIFAKKPLNEIEINMEKTTFISARGIGAIAYSYKKIINNSISCSIIVRDPIISELFAISGLSELTLS